MSEFTETNTYVLSRFEGQQKTFYLKPSNGDDEKLAVVFSISLHGLSNGVTKSVNTDMPLSNYSCCRLINPYLNAQSDVFKIKIRRGDEDKTVGYIFPASALEGDEEDVDENFDEAKQAYKFYCIKNLIERHSWNESYEGKQINISAILKQESSYLIIYKPLIADGDFSLTDLAPNLALHGYYYYPSNAKPTVLNFLNFGQSREELNEIINGRYLFIRAQKSIALKNSRVILDQSPLIKLLYNQLLVEADNPLYRFLVLYQVIEYLVDKYFKRGLDAIILEKEKYSNYKFLQQIHELNNTRSTINKLFESTFFEEKLEITGILRSFILEFDTDYNKHATGDCLYDIRNLLFHDYKNVLESNRDGALVGLVIQCEILIHQLIIGLSTKSENATTA